MDYNETTVSGTSWTRAVKVVIENPYNATPILMMIEEKITNLNGVIFRKPEGAPLVCQKDPASQLHTDIYDKLNELYVLLREARDTAPPAPALAP